MRKPLTIGLTALALTVALSGCGGTANTTTEPDKPAAPAAPAEKPSEAAKPAGAAEFGSTVTFPTGVTVKVTPPVVVPLTQYAAGGVDGQAVAFDISVTNGSEEPYEAFLEGAPNVTYGESGQQAEIAIDMDAGLTGDTFSTILPGETQTVRVGYGIPAAEHGNIRVEITASDMTSDPAIFKGAVQ